MPPVYDPADDLEGISTALFAHFARRHERSFDAWKTPENGFFFPPEAPTLWIKFNPDAPTLIKESKMQSYVHNYCPLSANCRIPKIRRVYELPDKTNGNILGARLEDLPWGLMVMDYSKGTRLLDLPVHKQDPLFQDILASRIAAILVQISSLRPPQGTAPGSCNGDSMSSLVWGHDDFDAPQAFDTVEKLEEYINTQIEDIPVTTTSDFSNEPLCLCYGDFNEGNFLLDDPTDPHSTLTVIDFERTNWLPISFLLWEVVTRHYEDGPFYKRIAAAVKKILPQPLNLDNIQALQSLRWKRGRQG